MPGGTAFALTVRRDLWQRLGAGDRAMFEACAGAEYQIALAEAKTCAALARSVMAPVSRLPFTAELRAAAHRAAADVVERLAGLDPAARRIADSYRAFRKLAAADAAASA